MCVYSQFVCKGCRVTVIRTYGILCTLKPSQPPCVPIINTAPAENVDVCSTCEAQPPAASAAPANTPPPPRQDAKAAPLEQAMARCQINDAEE